MSIKAEIGLNTTPFMKGAQEVKAATERMMKDAGEAAGKHGHSAHEGGFAFKGHKAERGIVKLSKDLLSAHSSSEALAAGLERVGKIFSLGLGIGVAAHVSALLIEKNEKLNEQYEQLHQSAEAFAESSAQAAQFGGFTENIGELAKAAKLIKDLTDARAKDGGFFKILGATLSGSPLDVQRRQRQAGKDIDEAKELARENAEAALEDLRFTAEIAELKAQGHDEEAAALERERKLKRDLLLIDKSGLDEHGKKEASALVKEASESTGNAAELKRLRDEQLATEKEIADLDHKESELIGERVHLGETEAEHAARLVSEVGSLATQYAELEKYQGTIHQHEGDALKIAQLRTAAAEKMNELVKIGAAAQKKANEEDARLAKSRQEALPGLAQSAYALAAAATGNDAIVQDVDRRTRYSKHLENLKKEGFGDDDAKRLAANQTRLEDLKKLQDESEKRGHVGRADAARRVGGGGYAERGSDVSALTRIGNSHLAEIKAILAETRSILARQKPVTIDTTSKFN